MTDERIAELEREVADLRAQVAALRGGADPVPAGGEGDAWQVVLDALPEGPLREACAARRALGVARYGQPLALRGDGLDSLGLLLPEVLDCVAYALRASLDETLTADQRQAAQHVLSWAVAGAVLMCQPDASWSHMATTASRVARAQAACGARLDGPVARSSRGVGW